jgi:hypothetical protein
MSNCPTGSVPNRGSWQISRQILTSSTTRSVPILGVQGLSPTGNSLNHGVCPYPRSPPTEVAGADRSPDPQPWGLSPTETRDFVRDVPSVLRGIFRRGVQLSNRVCRQCCFQGLSSIVVRGRSVAKSSPPSTTRSVPILGIQGLSPTEISHDRRLRLRSGLRIWSEGLPSSGTKYIFFVEALIKSAPMGLA